MKDKVSDLLQQIFLWIIGFFTAAIIFTAAPEYESEDGLVHRVCIKHVINAERVEGRDILNVIIVFNEKVPNSKGLLVLKVADKEFLRIKVYPVGDPKETKTEYLSAQMEFAIEKSQEELDLFCENLKKYPGTLYSWDDKQ